MTEAEWLACEDRSIQTVEFNLDPRRQRLFASACCRLLEQWLVPPAPDALDAIEHFADTGKTKAALRRARQALRPVRHNLQPLGAVCARGFWTLWAVEVAATENTAFSVPQDAERALREDAGMTSAEARRRLFGPFIDMDGSPEGTFACAAAWRTSTAVAIAKGIYESRDFGAIPILADALQDAGCDSDDVLNHCRRPGPHDRGCWVVDLVLGKE